jgi:hypothetical protein
MIDEIKAKLNQIKLLADEIAVMVDSLEEQDTNIYVSPMGSDSNAGTVYAPFRTIQKAADVVQPGQTVFIQPGTYKEAVILKASGTADEWITFQGDNCVIDGDGIPLYDARKAVFDTGSKSYIVIQGIRVINADYFGIGDMAGETSGGHDIVVKNCSTHNTGSSGIAFFWGAKITITNNVVEYSNVKGPQEAISLHGIDEFTINGNEVFDGLKEGIDAKGGSRNGKIFDNYVHDLLGGEYDMNGIYIDAFDRHAVNIEVYGNLVERCGNGIIVGAESGGHAQYINVHDNTIRSCRAGFALSGWGQGSDVHNVSDIEFHDNVITGASDNCITVSNAGLRNITIVNNVLGGRYYSTDAIEMTKGVTAVDPSVVIDSNKLCSVGVKPSNLAGTNITLLEKAPTPTNVRVTQDGGNATVSWDDMGAICYEVFRCNSTLNTGYYKRLGAVDTSEFLEMGLARGTYWYKIVANNNLAASDMSAPVKVVIS